MEELEIRQILANNLKKLRKQKGLSQLKLVSPETLARFSSFFEVPVSTFFISGDENNVNSAKNDFFVKTVIEEVNKTLQEISARFIEQ